MSLQNNFGGQLDTFLFIQLYQLSVRIKKNGYINMIIGGGRSWLKYFLYAGVKLH